MSRQPEETHAREDRLDIALIGGGICGLALACALVRSEHTVHVYEAASALQEVGAGVGLGPNAIQALRALGILEQIVSRSDEQGLQQRGFEFYIGDEAQHELIYTYPSNDETLGLGIHRSAFANTPRFSAVSEKRRASMLDALVELLPQGTACLNKRAVSLSMLPEGRVEVVFADGSTINADVVIGSDGIKSVVRQNINTSSTKPMYMNQIAYRGLVPIHELELFKPGELRCPRMYGGIDKHIICFPVRGSTLLNVVAFCCDRSCPYGSAKQPLGLTWTASASQEELLDQYRGWGPQVQAILKGIPKPTKWTLYALQPTLETYAASNIALIGDAAHGTLPHLGAGAGQGLEDAVLLNALLSHPVGYSRANIPHILQAYSEVRAPRANDVLEASTRAGEIWEGRGPHGPSTEGRRQDTVGIWEWIWRGYRPEEELRKALEKTESLKLDRVRHHDSDVVG